MRDPEAIAAIRGLEEYVHQSGLDRSLMAINGWNRLTTSFRTVPGTYQPRAAGT